jgi:hypothetical protein
MSLAGRAAGNEGTGRPSAHRNEGLDALASACAPIAGRSGNEHDQPPGLSAWQTAGKRDVSGRFHPGGRRSALPIQSALGPIRRRARQPRRKMAGVTALVSSRGEFVFPQCVVRVRRAHALFCTGMGS